MKTVKYLTIESDGKCARITNSPTACRSYQVCIRLDLEVPDAYFNRPQFVVVVNMPEPGAPIFSEADVSSAEEAIKQATGMNIQLTIAPEEK